jgi:nitrous oxide reductase
MTEAKKTERNDRRKFLKDLAVAGGATAAVMVSGGAQAAEPETADAGEARVDEGYKVTPHVETYYSKARF